MRRAVWLAGSDERIGWKSLEIYSTSDRVRHALGARFWKTELWGTILDIKPSWIDDEILAKVQWDRYEPLLDSKGDPPFFVERGISGWTRSYWLRKDAVD